MYYICLTFKCHERQTVLSSIKIPRSAGEQKDTIVTKDCGALGKEKSAFTGCRVWNVTYMSKRINLSVEV